jgi:hypothetical protein
MAQTHKTESSLTSERSNVIAQLIAEGSLVENFKLLSPSDYRRRIGNLAQALGHDIKAEEVHEFVLSKLPKLLGNMFGWEKCGITGANRPDYSFVDSDSQ